VITSRCSLLALLVVGSACDETVPTPPGVLLDVAAFTKLSVTDWTLGAPKAPPAKLVKSYRYTLGRLGPDVRFRIAFEHGPAELVVAKPKSAAPPQVDVPRAVRIEALENTAWAMTARCDDDLKVPLEVNPDGTSAYPKSVWASCQLSMKRKNGDITVAPWIEVHGDGKLVVKAMGPDDHVVED
jgi:hypothetical protein